MLTAAIYTRISHDDEQKGTGVERQQQLCRDLAERLGYAVSVVFEENDTGASEHSRKPRPIYAELMQRAATGEWDAIISYSTSRLTRRRREFLDLLDLVRDHGVQVRTVASGDLDLSTAAGKSMAYQLANWDATEADFTSERVRAAMKQRAEKGLPNGRIGFGFQRVDGVDVVNPEEAALLQEVARRMLGGEGLRGLSKELNERGVLTRAGKPWDGGAMRQVLKRPSNAGLRVHQGKVVRRGGAAIWDEDFQARVDAHLADPRRKKNAGPQVRHLLSGLVTCGRCGGSVMGKPGRLRYRKRTGDTVQDSYYVCYECHGVLANEVHMDRAVVALVLERLQQADGPELLADKHRRAEARAAYDKIDAARAKLRRAAQNYARDVIDDEQLATISADLRQQITQLERTVRSTAANEAVAEFAAQAQAQSIVEAWVATPMESRRALIRALLQIQLLPAGRKGATFTPDRLAITWNGEQQQPAK